MVIWSFDWRKWLQELKKNELFANYTSLPQISLLSLCSQGSAAVVAVWTFVSLALLIRRDILLCSNTTLHGVQNNLSRLSCKTFVNPFARSLFVIFVLPVSRNLSVINPQLHTLTGENWFEWAVFCCNSGRNCEPSFDWTFLCEKSVPIGYNVWIAWFCMKLCDRRILERVLEFLTSVDLSLSSTPLPPASALLW